MNSPEKMHFDITLLEPDKCSIPNFTEDTEIPHKVRQKVYHPLPSQGYVPMLGSVPEMPFRRGLSVTCINQHIPVTKKYSFKSSISPLLFAYCLEGFRHLRIKGTNIEHTTQSGSWYIGYIPECQGEGIMRGNPHFNGVTFRFDPLVLFDLLEGKMQGLPKRLTTLLKHLESGVITLSGKMSPQLKGAVAQLSQAYANIAFSRLYFESKLIDVLMLHLQEIGSEPKEACTAMSHEDKCMAHNARMFVQNQLSTPPSLKTIAEEVQASPFAVKSVFKKAYGMSLHSFIQTKRLEFAKQLLDSGEYQVGEVADIVGYQNVSWFIDSFFRAYGLKPGEYLRQTKRLYCISTPWAKASSL